MKENVTTIILAAGKGTRMGTNVPKVLNEIGGQTMLEYVLDCSEKISSHSIVVYGYGRELIEKKLVGRSAQLILQEEQKGTGHAVECAIRAVKTPYVVVLYGDVPLTQPATIEKLLQQIKEHELALLTMDMPNPTGYGRIIRNFAGNPIAIVEEKDATTDQKKVCEINTGIVAAHTDKLRRWLPQLKNDNAQGEFYLTDVLALAELERASIATNKCDNLIEIQGVNTSLQLSQLERVYQLNYAKEIASKGVILKDLSRVDFRGKIEIKRGTVVDVNCVFEGNVSIGEGCVIEPGCIIRDSVIASNVHIKPYTLVEDSIIEDGCTVGPFARVRPKTHLSKQVRIGNFVEIKASKISKDSSVNHLSYIGDSQIGERVNVGAGVITCNYDGIRKNQTIIGTDAFIGSGTQLVAPVEIGEGATIGAGSTIRKDAPDNQLTLSIKPQSTKKKWKRPKKTT